MALDLGLQRGGQIQQHRVFAAIVANPLGGIAQDRACPLEIALAVGRRGVVTCLMGQVLGDPTLDLDLAGLGLAGGIVDPGPAEVGRSQGAVAVVDLHSQRAIGVHGARREADADQQVEYLSAHQVAGMDAEGMVPGLGTPGAQGLHLKAPVP